MAGIGHRQTHYLLRVFHLPGRIARHGGHTIGCADTHLLSVLHGAVTVNTGARAARMGTPSRAPHLIREQRYSCSTPACGCRTLGVSFSRAGRIRCAHGLPPKRAALAAPCTRAAIFATYTYASLTTALIFHTSASPLKLFSFCLHSTFPSRDRHHTPSLQNTAHSQDTRTAPRSVWVLSTTAGAIPCLFAFA